MNNVAVQVQNTMNGIVEMSAFLNTQIQQWEILINLSFIATVTIGLCHVTAGVSNYLVIKYGNAFQRPTAVWKACLNSANGEKKKEIDRYV